MSNGIDSFMCDLYIYIVSYCMSCWIYKPSLPTKMAFCLHRWLFAVKPGWGTMGSVELYEVNEINKDVNGENC